MFGHNGLARVYDDNVNREQRNGVQVDTKLDVPVNTWVFATSDGFTMGRIVGFNTDLNRYAVKWDGASIPRLVTRDAFTVMGDGE